MATGRERAWDLDLDGIPLLCLRDEQGVAVYSALNVPKIAAESLQIAEEQRDYSSLHLGFGYSRFLIPNSYDYADGVDTTLPRRIRMGPLVTTMTAAASVTGGFVELGSTFWAAAGRYLQKVYTSGDDEDTLGVPDGADYTLGKDFGSGAAISSVNAWDSLIDVWFSSATNGFTFSGSAAPTELSSNTIKGSYAAKFWSDNAGAYVLARSFVNSNSDPAVTWIAAGSGLDTTNWVADPGYTVGDDTKAITALAGAKKMGWIGKRDGLYLIDGSTGHARAVFAAYPVHDDNGKGTFVDSAGRVWYPSKGGLLRYNPSSGLVEDVTPGRGLSHDSAIYGWAGPVTQYKGRYFCPVYNGTTSYVMEGHDREEGEPGVGPVVWHGAIAKATGQITHLYVLGQTSPPRLYWAAGTSIGYIRLDAARRYAASGSIYFPADNMGLVGSRWSLAGFIVTCKGFNTSTYGDFYVKMDGGSDWQPVNRLQASGRVFIPMPAGEWRFSELAFRIDLTNASSTTTPEIWGITVLATRRVYTRALIQTSVICSKRVLSHYGIPDRRSARSVLQQLEALAVQGPVTLKDWWDGKLYSQRVLVQPVRWRMVRFKDGDRFEEVARVAELTMVALSSEAVQVESAPTRIKWNSGAKWGSAGKWG